MAVQTSAELAAEDAGVATGADPLAGEKPRACEFIRVENAVQGQCTIVNPHSGHISQLNESASLIWECCDGAHAIDAIARKLVLAFEIDHARARNDVCAVVRQLHALGLLVTAGE